MKGWNLTPRSMVILHFGGLALLWGGLAVTGMSAGGIALSLDGAKDVRAVFSGGIGFAMLALHAAVVVLLGWRAPRWFFAHGPLAVVFGGLPLLPLVANLWLVPAFLNLIAVLHIGLASRHDSPGRLQIRR